MDIVEYSKIEKQIVFISRLYSYQAVVRYMDPEELREFLAADFSNGLYIKESDFIEECSDCPEKKTFRQKRLCSHKDKCAYRKILGIPSLCNCDFCLIGRVVDRYKKNFRLANLSKRGPIPQPVDI